MFSAFERLISFRYLRSRRRDGFISVIAGFSLTGIALGVATLIVVMAVMNGFRDELLSRILGINAHITIAGYAPITDYQNLAQEIKKIPGVVDASPVVEGQVMVRANGNSSGALVRGISPEDLQRRPLIAKNIKSGNVANFQGKDAVLIGTRMAENFGLKAGDYITLISPQTTDTVIGAIPRLKDFRIAGTFEVGMYEYDSSNIFMPLEAGQVYFKSPNAASEIEVMVSEPEKAGMIAAKIFAETGGKYRVSDWKLTNSHFFNALNVERNVMFLILALIILVAAFNIISSLIMLVKDKAKAIAILRTMGASRGSIMRIFFLCGASVGVTGTFLGFLLGLGFARNIDRIKGWLEHLSGTELFAPEIYFLSHLPARVEAHDVIMIVTMSLVLTLLATIYPSLRAARLDPAEGLRYE